MVKINNILKKTGSQLSNVSSEELATQQGLSSSPITPAGAGLIGAGPDSQKMAGTPNQKRKQLSNAVNATVATGNTLSNRLSLGKPATSATEAQQGQINTLQQRTGQLSDLGQNIGQATSAAIGQAVNTGLENLTTDIWQLDTIDPNIPEIDLLTEYKDALNSGDQFKVNSALANLANAGMDKATADSHVTAKPVTDISVQVNSTNLRDLNTQLPGSFDIANMSEILGLPEEEIESLTPTQLTDKIEEAIDNEFKMVENAKEVLSDPYSTPTQKAEAAELLADFDTLGVSEADRQADKLAEEIADADLIAVGDKEYTAEELLGDEGISNFLETEIFTLSGEARQEALNDLAANYPELAEFVDRYEGILEEATGSREELGAEFVRIQEENNRLSGGLDDSVLTMIAPELVGASASVYSGQRPSLIENLSSEGTFNKQDKLNLIGFAQHLASQGDELSLSKLSNLPKEQLQVIAKLPAEAQLEALNPEITTNNIQEIFNSYVEGFSNVDHMKEALTNGIHNLEYEGDGHFNRTVNNIDMATSQLHALLNTVPANSPQYNLINGQLNDILKKKNLYISNQTKIKERDEKTQQEIQAEEDIKSRIREQQLAANANFKEPLVGQTLLPDNSVPSGRLSSPVLGNMNKNKFKTIDSDNTFKAR